MLGSIVWAHHMFTAGLRCIYSSLFSAATMIIAVPPGIKMLCWLATIWGGSFKFKTPLLFTLGFIFLFVMVGVTGVVMSYSGLDIALHDT